VILPELLKCAINLISKALHEIFIQVWRTGHVPSDWKDGILIALYKEKGPKVDCSSYRPITLLSVPGKVFAHVLLARIQPLIDLARRPKQSGFVAGRSTTVRTTSRVRSPIKRRIPRYKSSLRLRGQTCSSESAPEQRCPSYPRRSNQRTSRWHSCPSARRTGTIRSPTHNLRGPTGVCSGPITFLHCHRLDPTAHDIATGDHCGPTTLH